MRKAAYRKKLEAEKEGLESQLASMGRRSVVPDDWEPAPVEPANDSDPIDQADTHTARQNDAAVLDALEARYDTILEALKRLEKGTYGACEVCGEEIAAQRLDANPAATTCAAHMG